MKYVLRSTLLIDCLTAELSSQEFEQARSARRALVSGFGFEEIFDHFLSNYLEIEMQCLAASAQRLVRDGGSYADFYQRRAPINLAVVNFLSAARLYVDQVDSKVSASFYGTAGPQRHAKILLAREYDAAFEYRFVEALRNHVQHSGTAVHILNTSWHNSPPSELQETEVRTTVFCDRRSIAEDKKFKKRVLAECPPEVNLLDAVRQYVMSISAVHRELRQAVEPSQEAAQDRIQSIQALLANECEGAPDALVAVAIDETGRELESVPLLLVWEEVRQSLRDRNGGLHAVRTHIANRGQA